MGIRDFHSLKNRNYTTYLEVGGTSYNPAGIIYTNVDSDSSGANDIWIWNGSIWLYNNTAKLYDLDINGNGVIDGAEICKLCHSLELMGINKTVSQVHTVGTRYCDDDRCHGNKNHSYNDYRLFKDRGVDLTKTGLIISNNSVHGGFYNDATGKDSNNSIYFHSYGQVPGNAAPYNNINISLSPYTCLGCHSYINVTGSIKPGSNFNHSNANASKGRYT